MNQFGSFTASELYCPKCGRSQPVREKLLLQLPSGELYDFLCAGCGSSLGSRTVTDPGASPTILTPGQIPPAERKLLARG